MPPVVGQTTSPGGHLGYSDFVAAATPGSSKFQKDVTLGVIVGPLTLFALGWLFCRMKLSVLLRSRLRRIRRSQRFQLQKILFPQGSNPVSASNNIPLTVTVPTQAHHAAVLTATPTLFTPPLPQTGVGTPTHPLLRPPAAAVQREPSGVAIRPGHCLRR